jgi:hypothetical protein
MSRIVRLFQICLVPVSLAMCAGALADLTVKYEGPDILTLVTRANTAGTNARGAAMQVRELPADRLNQVLGPIVAKALEGCAMDGVSRVAIKPAVSLDRIGGTMSRFQGLGIYVNLSLADRVTIGNWYVAPFFSIGVSLLGEADKVQESADLLEFNRVILDRDVMSQDKFLDAKTADVEATVIAFAQARLPSSLRSAFARRCPRTP